VLIGWDTQKENSRLNGTVIGFGGSSSAGVTGGPLVYVSGNVALSAEWYASVLRTPKGYAQGEAVLLHELGHLLGLGHVPDKSQIMFEMERPQVTKLGVGDLAGLAKLGGGACEPRL
jgi:predicted Zn-dependent protease